MDEFFTKLEQCDGAVIGSVARHLFLSNDPKLENVPRPRDLNIVTSFMYSEQLYDFFLSLGYKAAPYPIEAIYRKSVDHADLFTKMVGDEVCFLDF